MPAINLSLLKKQSVNLASLFDQPVAFVRTLRDLLDLYADRVHRFGQAGEPPPMIQAYHVPAPMLRQLAQELNPYTTKDATSTLALCDVLWAEPTLEPRLLAASLLGQAPLTPIEAIFERVQNWAQFLSEQRLLNALVQQGLNRSSRERPDHLVKQASIWLASDDINLERLGLKTLQLLVLNANFDNMPSVLNLLTPFVRTAPFPIRADIMDLLAALARRFPRETAYYLRQTLESPDYLETARLIRQVIRYFPAETQLSLRSALRQLR